MMTNEPGTREGVQSVKCHPDEPVFVLCARDPLAPILVRVWAMLSFHLRSHRRGKVSGAFQVAADMETWRDKHPALCTRSQAERGEL